jgi:hypothetical protein
MTAVFTGVVWIVNSLVIPETYAPYLLRRRAAVLSKRTGKVYISKIDVGRPHTTIATQLKTAILRPWVLLFKEPIVLLTSLYMAIIYGTLYLCFAAFPIVFQKGRGWSPGIGGLAFTGIAVGMLFAVTGTILDQKRYTRAAEAAGGHAPPEARLPPSLVGSILIPVGLFWFAWTNGKDVHWIVSIIGSAFFACGLVSVFLSLLNYLIDSCKFRCSDSSHLLQLNSSRCYLRCFGVGCKLNPALPLWRCVPALHDVHVQRPGNSLGQLHPCLPGRRLCPVSVPVLQVRRNYPYEVRVCRRSRQCVTAHAHQARGHHGGPGRRGGA